MTSEIKITKKAQFDVIRSVRKQLRAIQDAVRAEDRETANRVALELSGNVLNLRTEELEAKLRGQE
jgi:hypothetical protein